MFFRLSLSLISLVVATSASAADAQEFVPGEVIVKLKGKKGTQESFAFLGKAHSEKEMVLKDAFNQMNMYHFSLRKGQRVEDAVKELQADPNVEYAEPNYILRKSGDTGIVRTYSDSEIKEMSVQSQGSVVWATGGVDFGLDRFHQEKTALAQSVAKPIVAVIDTGLDISHPVFTDTGSVWTNTNEIAGNGVDDDGNGFVDDIHGWNFVDNSGTMYDDDDHGTHVSGIILSVDQNIEAATLVPSRIAIMPLKFLDSHGSGSTSNAIRAIYYAVNNGAVVMNNSWGGSGYSGALHEALSYAYDQGVAVAAAAGNAAYNNDSVPMYPASYGVPNIMSIAATTDADTLASFSNYGRNTVHVGSPGVMIYSTIPGGWGTASGTSMATPFVSGIAIQMKVEAPTMRGYQIKSIILAQATHRAGLVGKVYTEARVEAANAINYAKTATLDASQPAYYGALSGNRELASSLSGGGCGLVTKMYMDAQSRFGGPKGPSSSPQIRGPQTWYVLLVIGLLLMPVMLMNYLKSRTPEQRRRHERFRINSEVTVQVGGKDLVGSISTISMGGVQLNTQELIEKGGIVNMTISSPDGKEQVKVEGHVVWSEANKAYGVAFDNAPRTALYRIAQWTKSLQKAS